jgi:hypothetical protein
MAIMQPKRAPWVGFCAKYSKRVVLGAFQAEAEGVSRALEGFWKEWAASQEGVVVQTW